MDRRELEIRVSLVHAEKELRTRMDANQYLLIEGKRIPVIWETQRTENVVKEEQRLWRRLINALKRTT